MELVKISSKKFIEAFDLLIKGDYRRNFTYNFIQISSNPLQVSPKVLIQLHKDLNILKSALQSDLKSTGCTTFAQYCETSHETAQGTPFT